MDEISQSQTIDETEKRPIYSIDCHKFVHPSRNQQEQNKMTMRVYAGWNETDLILANSPECFWHCPQGKVDYALSINEVYEPVQVEHLLQHIVEHQQKRGKMAANLRIMQLPKDNCVYWRWGLATDGECFFFGCRSLLLEPVSQHRADLETSGLKDRETPGKASDGRWAQLIGCIPRHTVSVHIGGLLDDMPETFAALARPECPILKKFTLRGNFKNYEMLDMWGEEGLSRGETGHGLSSLGLSLEFFRNGIGPVLRRVMGQAEEVAEEFEFTIDNVVGKDKYVNGVEGGQYTDYFQPLTNAGLRPNENVSLGRIYFPVEFFKTDEEVRNDPRATWWGGPQRSNFSCGKSSCTKGSPRLDSR